MVILVSNSCYRPYLGQLDQRQVVKDFTFSRAISKSEPQNFGKVIYETNQPAVNLTKARQSQTESDRYGSNGSATKMVPTKDLVRRRDPSRQEPTPVNGTKVSLNGFITIKRDNTSQIFKTKKNIPTGKIPSIDEVKVLPLDEGFSWANDNYSYWQRTLDIWNFVLSLRLRILFLNANWTYFDGFTVEKQVSVLEYNDNIYTYLQIHRHYHVHILEKLNEETTKNK